jgi:hypothetical protein
MVDLNEKELFALMVLASTDHREKRNKGIDVAFEEVLELKLVEALLTETGHWPPAPFTDNQRLEALRLIEEMRIKEESLSLSTSEDRQPGQQ